MLETKFRGSSEDPDKISVAEVDSLLYSANHDLGRIAIAAHVPALSQGMEGLIRSLSPGCGRWCPQRQSWAHFIQFVSACMGWFPMGESC